MRTVTVEELHALARDAFGADRRAWRFRCPACGAPADGAAFLRAVGPRPDRVRLASDLLGQECIGRWVPGAGCDARAVTAPDVWLVKTAGGTVAAFPLDLPGPAPAAPASEPARTELDAPAPASAPSDDDRYRHNADADRNRYVKAGKLAAALDEMGLHPGDVVAADRTVVLDRARRLAARHRAFPKNPDTPRRALPTASDETWLLAAALLNGRQARRSPG